MKGSIVYMLHTHITPRQVHLPRLPQPSLETALTSGQCVVGLFFFSVKRVHGMYITHTKDLIINQNRKLAESNEIFVVFIALQGMRSVRIERGSTTNT